MKILIIGYGSIGKKHAQAAKLLGGEVQLISSQEGLEFKTYKSLDLLSDINEFDLIIVANPTSLHREVVSSIQEKGFINKLLIEKPIFSKMDSSLPKIEASVAYNLRMLPGLIELRNRIQEQKVLSVQCYVGSYLPGWRHTDYKKSYSASKELGGGVLRDLSHELDYIQWLFGPIKKVLASGGSISHLEIESEDVIQALLVTEQNIRISLEMNFYDRNDKRFVNVCTDSESLSYDFITSELVLGSEKKKGSMSINETYQAQIKKIMENKLDGLCTYEEGLNTVALIEAMEASMFQSQWVDIK